jgi:hypothetical protein
VLGWKPVRKLLLKSLRGDVRDALVKRHMSKKKKKNRSECGCDTATGASRQSQKPMRLRHSYWCQQAITEANAAATQLLVPAGTLDLAAYRCFSATALNTAALIDVRRLCERDLWTK